MSTSKHRHGVGVGEWRALVVSRVDAASGCGVHQQAVGTPHTGKTILTLCDDNTVKDSPPVAVSTTPGREHGTATRENDKQAYRRWFWADSRPGWNKWGTEKPPALGFVFPCYTCAGHMCNRM